MSKRNPLQQHMVFFFILILHVFFSDARHARYLYILHVMLNLKMFQQKNLVQVYLGMI